ncbi:MAG: GNAT family N-acetyltransferase [Thermoprotei archaeon]
MKESSDEAYKGGVVKNWILADDLLPQLSLGYRGLVIIEGEDYGDALISLLRSVKEKVGPSRVVYAFHPWMEGAKDRLREVRSLFDGVKDVDYSHSEDVLGSTFELAILDCVDDFRPNYLARIIDTVKGGGLAIVYSDDLSSPKKLYKSTLIRGGSVDSLFEKRFRRLAKSKEGIAYVGETTRFRPYLRKPRDVVWTDYRGVRVTEDQAKVIREADFLFHSEEPRTYVITAPRGRGKSYATGVLLGDLLKRRENLRAVVTSPTLMNAQEVFRGASSVRGVTLIKSKSGEAKGVRRGSSIAEWLPPEMASYSEGDLVIVDEFATIPNEVLDEILRKWKKVILTSTTFGYEGSGKAFKKLLDRVKRTHLVKHATMETPIRYPPGDPVEAFLNDAFLLKPTDATLKGVRDGVHEVPREELANNEALLRSVYSVLLTAHYRNSPDDLMFLLDMKFQRVIAEIRNGGVIGVAELVYEGGLGEQEIERLYEGKENAGHLIPHRLIKFLGDKEFGHLKGLRVMRIAVVEEEQGRGHGSELLKTAEELANAEGLDWLGSSFISDYGVLRFWLKNGYTPVHIASRGNEALSGFSIIVLKGLNERAQEHVWRLARRLKEKLILTSHQVYYKLSPLVLASLLKGTPPLRWHVEIGEDDLKAVQRYFDGDLPYNAVADSFHKLLLKALTEDVVIGDQDLAVLVARVLQGKSWSQIALSLGLGGSSNAEKAFREASFKFFKALFRYG